MKPALIGESNPEGEWALYPSPEGSSGHRLCHLILQMTAEEYLEKFDRVNLCNGPWDIGEAKIAVQLLRNEKLILLGGKVARAFGILGRPVLTPLVLGFNPPRRAMIVPHPSGLNHWYSDPANRESVKRAIEEFIK